MARRAFVPALLVGALLLVSGTAQAALPAKGATFAFHDHQTAGKKWHVEVQIDSQDAKKVKTLVVYGEQCKATIAKANVAISDAGVLSASGGLNGGGTWAVQATFVEPTKLVGAMRMTRTNCDTGLLSFPSAITGDGHTDHQHAGGGGHAHGPKFPDFASSKVKHRKQARALHRRVLKRWGAMTLAGAEHRGFFQAKSASGKALGMFHVYNRRYEHDKLIFDAKRPESLVFWRPAQGPPVILGAMFRVPGTKRPRFAGPIPIYHGHGSNVRNRMTHVWIVRGVKSAWANCLPTWHLTQYNPAFAWMPGGSKQGPNDDPC